MVEKVKKMTKPLRIIDTELYYYIVQGFYERHNIHSYDIEALAVKKTSGLNIILRYGENYTKSKEGLFTFATLENRCEELTTFIHEAADDCKKVMVADYFKMMKP